MNKIINFLKKNGGATVFLITFLVYSPILFNQYVGDDYHIIVRNMFYHSWHNVPRVFGNESISDTRKRVFNSESQVDLGTGRASYRPVSNLSYFLDYSLFKAQPYGSHLISILIHCVNSALVYWIVNQIFSSSALGILAGLLFSLHPIQTEAVALMSNRADILAAMFALFSFYFWIKFKRGEYGNKKYYCGSLGMCFLALFSKESAFTLPLVILLADRMLTSQLNLKPRGIYYIGYIVVFIFYLCLYFLVYPSNFHPFYWLGGSPVNHCLEIGYIWYNYLINVLMPWTVKMIPAQYNPPVPKVISLLTAGIGIALMVLIAAVCMLWRKYKECAFFLLWYIAFYIPLSNLIPVVNPMANRYMYLPSIGLFIVLAFFLDKIFKSNSLSKYSRHLPVLLCGAIVAICASKTLLLTNDWKSNFDVGWAWVRDYPTDYEGYAVLGGEYLNVGDIQKAKQYLEKSVQLGGRTPIELKTLADCYILLGDIDAAERLLKKTMAYYPDYNIPYLYLGEIYYNHNLNQQAQVMLEKALALNPREPLEHSYLRKVYLRLHRP